MMSEPMLNDSWFYDESDFIQCDTCYEWFDHNTYNSDTCSQCEDVQQEVEKLKNNSK
jgi:hypothetical protein